MSIQFITWVERELITEDQYSRGPLGWNSLEVECTQHGALKIGFCETFCWISTMTNAFVECFKQINTFASTLFMFKPEPLLCMLVNDLVKVFGKHLLSFWKPTLYVLKLRGQTFPKSPGNIVLGSSVSWEAPQTRGRDSSCWGWGPRSWRLPWPGGRSRPGSYWRWRRWYSRIEWWTASVCQPATVKNFSSQVHYKLQLLIYFPLWANLLNKWGYLSNNRGWVETCQLLYNEKVLSANNYFNKSPLL